jgi:hypothetical protein
MITVGMGTTFEGTEWGNSCGDGVETVNFKNFAGTIGDGDTGREWGSKFVPVHTSNAGANLNSAICSV